MSTRRIARRGTQFGLGGAGGIAALLGEVAQDGNGLFGDGAGSMWATVVLVLGLAVFGAAPFAVEKRHDREIRTAHIYAAAQQPVDDLEADDDLDVPRGGELEARVELEAEVARRRQAVRLTRDAAEQAEANLARAEADLLNTSQ